MKTLLRPVPPYVVAAVATVVLPTKRIFVALLCLLPFSAMAFTQSGSTFATNGSQSDVQTAINAAPPGSIVTIPSGSFTWSSRVLMTGALHLQGAGASSTTVICGVSD